MIRRSRELNRLAELLRRNPVVAIVGARQVGKTTLAMAYARRHKGTCTIFDLENPEDQARLQDPMLALSDLRGLVVIDEIQRRPDLFEVLRVLVDRARRKARFLLLGSASPALLRQSSETLAGRIVYHELSGFGLDEVGNENHRKLWLRGGFPRSYVARSNAASYDWRRAFTGTFLERDIPQLGINVSSTTLRRFWLMLAHYHGQRWNSSDLARSFGVADTTIRGYLDILTSALVVRQLPPWHESLKKRQVRAAKVYVADSGLLHALLNVRTIDDLLSHPKAGASWEGFAIGQVARRLGAQEEELYHWATHSGAELDLLVVRGRQRVGFEMKLTTSPSVTRSMLIASKDLRLGHLYVVHAGKDTFPLAENITAIAVGRLLRDLKPLL